MEIILSRLEMREVQNMKLQMQKMTSLSIISTLPLKTHSARIIFPRRFSVRSR